MQPVLRATRSPRAWLPAAALGCLGLLAVSFAEAQQTGTITLVGTLASHCTINVTATGAASNLDLSNGAKRIQVGNVLQNCNKKAGYTLHVASNNCTVGTAGAKLIGTTQAEVLPYSVEFANPPTGGSQTSVTGLLAAACSGAAVVTGRDVTDAKIRDETSQIFVNYTGDGDLAADSYTDALTIVMVAK